LNYYQIELTGPERDLHSGVYGGAVPNPLTILAELFAKLHDKNFRVAVPASMTMSRRFRKPSVNPSMLSPEEKRFREGRRRARLFWRNRFTTVERLWTRPTLELNGVWAATRRGREDRHPVEGVCQILHASGTQSGSAQNRPARREARSKAAAENRSLQI